jgi:hypothetical protein
MRHSATVCELVEKERKAGTRPDSSIIRISTSVFSARVPEGRY